MTTIACNSEMMAADSLVTWDDTKFYSDKIFRINGDIVGTSGDSDGGMHFLRWYADQTLDKPEEQEEFYALILKPSGKIELWGNQLIATPVNDKFFAIGSGKKAAIAAMHMGATPKEAVLISCKVDPYTEKPIKCLKLPPKANA